MVRSFLVSFMKSKKLVEVKHQRISKKKITKTPSLNKNPQKKGICLNVFIKKPKKPNSAQRKIAKVLLRNKNIVNVYIPGEGHNLQEHSTVLIQGGRRKDLPGIRYKVIRGVFDCKPVTNRRTSRSKYGMAQISK